MRMINGLILMGCLLCVGCGPANSPETGNAAPPSGVSAGFLVAIEPANAVSVGEARESAVNEQVVTLVGRIGGSVEPFVDGLVAFTIVDLAIPSCVDEEGCPTPWDYCCTQDQVRKKIATVKVVDPAGKPVVGDARSFLGVQELSTIVVQGTAQRDEQGNLSIAANRVFVRASE